MYAIETRCLTMNNNPLFCNSHKVSVKVYLIIRNVFFSTQSMLTYLNFLQRLKSYRKIEFWIDFLGQSLGKHNFM